MWIPICPYLLDESNDSPYNHHNIATSHLISCFVVLAQHADMNQRGQLVSNGKSLLSHRKSLRNRFTEESFRNLQMLCLKEISA
jgi:hypothetical protein